MKSVAPTAGRRFGPRSLRGTIVLSTVGLMTVSMLVVGLFIQLLLARAAHNDVDQVLHQRADAAIGIVQSASRHGLTVPQDTLEPGIEVYDANGQLVAGSVGGSVKEVATELASTKREQTREAQSEAARLLAVPFGTPGGETGVIVVTQDTKPYERSERYALYATGALAVLVIATSGWIALRVTRQALEPVALMEIGRAHV